MGISPVQLGIILVIVALLFGTKRLRGLGSDLGASIKGFKNAIAENSQNSTDNDVSEDVLSVKCGNNKLQAHQGKS